MSYLRSRFSLNELSNSLLCVNPCYAPSNFTSKRRSCTVMFSVEETQKSILEPTTNDVHKKTRFRQKKELLETLTEEFKALVFENDEFGYRYMTLPFAFFANF